MDQLREHAGKIAIGVVVLLGLAWFMMSSGTGVEQVQSGKVRFVCVETGETFWLPRGEMRIPPCENPKTGSATLVPAIEADGVVMVTERFRPLLEQLEKKNKWIDPKTFALRPSAD